MNQSSRIKNNKKYVKLDDDFSRFLIKHAVLASAFTFLLGVQIRELISQLVDTILKPLFSVDLDKNGEPDMKQLKRFTTNIMGIKYPVGKLFLELIKTIITIGVIYLSIIFLTRYTKFV